MMELRLKLDDFTQRLKLRCHIRQFLGNQTIAPFLFS
jgi:hypothetical protein